jgi:hypothetical protein
MKGSFPERTFDTWGLKFLRLARKSNCSYGHPSSYTTMNVAKSIPGLESWDAAWTCFCYVNDLCLGE